MRKNMPNSTSNLLSHCSFGLVVGLHFLRESWIAAWLQSSSWSKADACSVPPCCKHPSVLLKLSLRIGHCGEGSVLAHSVSPQLAQHPQKAWTMPRGAPGAHGRRCCMSVAAALDSCGVRETGKSLRWTVPVVQAKVALPVWEVLTWSPPWSTWS